MQWRKPLCSRFLVSHEKVIKEKAADGKPL